MQNTLIFSKTKTAGFLFILCFSIISAYSGVLKAPFVLDDFDNIVNNDNIKISKLGIKELARAGFSGVCANRPIPKISFALNYYFSKFDLIPFHIVNIIIHIFNAILVFFLIRQMLVLCDQAAPPSEGSNSPGWRIDNALFISFFTALIWALHPLQIQSVTYIVQRMNSLAAFFYLASFFVYIKWRESFTGKIAGAKSFFLILMSFVFFVLGLLSKENVIMLPFCVVAVEFVLFQKRNIFSNKNVRLVIYLLIFLVIMVVILYLGWNPVDKILGFYKYRNFTMYERVITEFRVIWFYLFLFFYPSPSLLNLDHDFSLSKGWLNPPSTLASLAGLLILLSISLWRLKRKDFWTFIWTMWFFINLFLESSFIALEIIFEHRCYLPTIGLSAIVVYNLCKLSKTPKVFLYICVLISLSFFCLTYYRNMVWSDEISLYRDIISKSPNKLRPYILLGDAYYRNNYLDKAKESYLNGLNIDPLSSKLLNNLGASYAASGDLDKAILCFKQAIEIEPDMKSSKINLEKAEKLRNAIDKNDSGLN